jgi:diguanylate cyclase (GGDEF)-like protein
MGAKVRDGERQLLEAIGSRVAPLILSAIEFDRSHHNALTDPTTALPNERAFFLVLENQLAEADRKRSDRPVTILAMDIKGFDDINRRFGYSTGDAILRHVSATIKESLRNMDFFARGLDDEFLAILATASKEISPDVIARVQAAFFGRRYKVDDSHSLELELNFGWAEFGSDGETATDVVKTARRRKAVTKHPETGTILSFSTRL